MQQDEEMLVVGNPVTWTEKANLRLVLPRKNLESTGDTSWANWIFKWDFGPKTAEELEKIPSTDNARNFEYGDILSVKSNGIYSIYVRDPENNVTVLNVNVTKIDDVSPIYKFSNSDIGLQIQAIDNETGIKHVKYKTLKNYNDNVLSAEDNTPEDLAGRTNVDYYLLDGKGKDLVYDLAAEIDSYKIQKTTIIKAIEDENNRYSRWLTENDMDLYTEEEKDTEASAHNDMILDLNNQLTALYEKYPYLHDIYGTTENSRLVMYIEDYAGNATVVGEKGFYTGNTGVTGQQYFLSTEILAKSYNISVEGL